MNKAVYFTKLKSGLVKCTLCPWNCMIPKGKTGYCKTRINYEGELYSLVYGEPTGFNVDPIEKKPLFHFNPGSEVLSFGTLGCNFRCEYCCNYYYSQLEPEKTTVINFKPEDIVKKALSEKCDGIAYTYNEPSIFLEYAMDTARIAHSKGLFNVFVTNGCINKEPLMDMDPYLDAAVIDFKGFNHRFYERYVHAKLDWVKEGVRNYAKLKAHKEVTNLVVPGLNDNPLEIKELCRFIIDNLGEDTPMHFLRFFPLYKMSDVFQTPISLLRKCYNIAKNEGLRYVYLGNVGTDEENTYCPSCSTLLIDRSMNRFVKSRLINNSCPKCGEKINVVGSFRNNNKPYFG